MKIISQFGRYYIPHGMLYMGREIGETGMQIRYNGND